MNLRSALVKAQNELNHFDTGNLDAKVLLLQATGKDEKYLITNALSLLSARENAKFEVLIDRRKKGEPVAYITGHKEFYGFDFKVNKNVLIPRPETELLVENALHFLESKNYKPEARDLDIIDIGTGSGCIIISLAKQLETRNYPPRLGSQSEADQLKTNLFASDVSEKALLIAKKNAKIHGVSDKISFYRSDLFENIKLPKNFDLIIANLPYLKPGYKNLDFEPRTALHGGKDGLAIIKRLMRLLPEKLNDDGVALLEIDYDQFDDLKQIADRKNHLFIEKIDQIPGWNGSIRITKMP